MLCNYFIYQWTSTQVPQIYEYCLYISFPLLIDNTVTVVCFCIVHYFQASWDSSVSIWAMGWTARADFLVEATDFSLLHSIQTGSGAHAASYTTGIGGCFPRSKEAGTRS
jgi:hypothetical protein